MFPLAQLAANSLALRGWKWQPAGAGGTGVVAVSGCLTGRLGISQRDAADAMHERGNPKTNERIVARRNDRDTFTNGKHLPQHSEIEIFAVDIRASFGSRTD